MSTVGVDRASKQFAEIERFPAELRQCVHEYGYPIIKQFICCGITKPGQIHNLMREIWEGARSSRQSRQRSGILDWLLIQAGAEITAAELCRALRASNLIIVPTTPTKAMIEASMATVSGFNLKVTKMDKHRLRLLAALDAGGNYFDDMQRQSTTEAA